MPSNIPRFDIIIAGAGIVGLATAWQIRRMAPGVRIALLEKESRPALHQSSRNSGVIHSGVYYEPGSAKAVNCIRGYHLMLDFAREYGLKHQICGKIIAATKEDEIGTLSRIFERGTQNGLTGLEMLDEQGSREAEPHVQAIQSIWVPQAGIIDYGEVSREMMRQLQDTGANFYFDHQVIDFRQELHHSVISTSYGDFHCGVFINCCGLYADRIALLTGMESAYRILPFRGEFYQVTGASAGLVNHLVYPVPDPRFPFLGVHFTLRLDGGLEAGPNAVLAFAREGYHLSSVDVGELSEILFYTGFHRMALRYWSKGWEELYRSWSKAAFVRSMQHLVPEVRAQDVFKTRSGVRAQCVGRDGRMLYDYLILETEAVINLVNAPSPAATSAFSIGQFVAEKACARLHA